MKVIWLVIILTALLGGCESALDKCFDSKAYLWNPQKNDNTYKGNERYWDAITECEDKY